MSAVMSESTPHAPAASDRRTAAQAHVVARRRSGGSCSTSRTSVAELQAVLAALPARMPLLWLGLGSNLLVRDGGFAAR